MPNKWNGQIKTNEFEQLQESTAKIMGLRKPIKESLKHDAEKWLIQQINKVGKLEDMGKYAVIFAATLDVGKKFPNHDELAQLAYRTFCDDKDYNTLVSDVDFNDDDGEKSCSFSIIIIGNDLDDLKQIASQYAETKASNGEDDDWEGDGGEYIAYAIYNNKWNIMKPNFKSKRSGKPIKEAVVGYNSDERKEGIKILQGMAEELQAALEGLGFPYVFCAYTGNIADSVIVRVALDAKADWPGGYWENAKGFMALIQIDDRYQQWFAPGTAMNFKVAINRTADKVERVQIVGFKTNDPDKMVARIVKQLSKLVAVKESVKEAVTRFSQATGVGEEINITVVLDQNGGDGYLVTREDNPNEQMLIQSNRDKREFKDNVGFDATDEGYEYDNSRTKMFAFREVNDGYEMHFRIEPDVWQSYFAVFAVKEPVKEDAHTRTAIGDMRQAAQFLKTLFKNLGFDEVLCEYRPEIKAISINAGIKDPTTHKTKFILATVEREINGTWTFELNSNRTDIALTGASSDSIDGLLDEIIYQFKKLNKSAKKSGKAEHLEVMISELEAGGYKLSSADKKDYKRIKQLHDEYSEMANDGE